VGVRVAWNGGPVKTILLTSPRAGEGKTTIALTLATKLAEKHRVCLIDADFRAPKLAKALGVKPAGQLAAALRSKSDMGELITPTAISSNLSIISASESQRDAGDLIISEPMRELIREASEMFDYVVIDAPPLMPFADARYLTRLVDGVLLIASAKSTTREAMVASTRMLTDERAHLIGVVLNRVSWGSELYRSYRYDRKAG
jgi:polysaccharide biosynthesis transport protein